MKFTKKNNISRIIRITGRQDNILGICFSKTNNNPIEVVVQDVKDGSKIQTSEDQVLNQVLSGLKEVNKSLGTNYQLSKIYFVPSDMASDSVYKLLIALLIRRYHNGNEFKEV